MSDKEKQARRAPLPIIHEECGGIFIFAEDPKTIPDERICQRCQLKETYEIDNLIVIGRPGILQDALKAFCELLGLKVIDKKVNQDRSNPSVFAVTVLAPGAGRYVNSDEWFEGAAKDKKFSHIVSAVCRKPRHRQSGTHIKI